MLYPDPYIHMFIISCSDFITLLLFSHSHHVWPFVTSWTAAQQAFLSFTTSRSLYKLMSTESVMPSNISSTVILFSFCLQSFPASGSFPMSRFFASGGRNIGASASVLQMNIKGWFPLGLTGLISLQFNGLSRVFSSTTIRKHQFFSAVVLIVQFSHLYVTIGKTTALTRQTFVGKVISLLFNVLLRFVIAFLPRSKYL